MTGCAPRRPEAARYPLFWIRLSMIPEYALHEKGLHATKRRRSTGQQPGTKSARGPSDEPLVSRSLCSPIGLHRISFVRVSGESLRTVFFDALGVKRVGLSPGRPSPSASRPAPPCPAPPPRSAPPRPDPPVVCPGFDSTSIPRCNLDDQGSYSLTCLA